jgi:1,4-dihydroxy-2-naphthoate octaprenyltransferase
MHRMSETPTSRVSTRVTSLDVLQLVDIRTKIVSVSSLLVGTAYAMHLTREFSAGLFLLMLVATLLIDMGTTGFNSYYDFINGVDTVDSDVERWKALVQRRIDPAFARRLAWMLFGGAALAGLAIGMLVDWSIVAVGAACMAIALLYSGGPLPIAKLPIGELFAGGMLGSVLVATAAYVQHPVLETAIGWLGLPSTVLIATILSVNNACDIEGDGRAGRRTLAVVVGVDRARQLIDVQLLLTLLLAVALIPLRVLSVEALVPLAAVAVAGWRERSAMYRRGFGHATKSAQMAGISKLFIFYTVTLLLGIGLTAWHGANSAITFMPPR